MLVAFFRSISAIEEKNASATAVHTFLGTLSGVEFTLIKISDATIFKTFLGFENKSVPSSAELEFSDLKTSKNLTKNIYRKTLPVNYDLSLCPKSQYLKCGIKFVC